MRSLIFPGIILFQILTIALYYVGPITYETGTTPMVGVYVSIYLIALIIGYHSARKYYFRGNSAPRYNFSFLRLSIFLTLLISVLEYIFIIGDLTSGSTFGRLYVESLQNTKLTGSWLGYILLLFNYYLFGLYPIYFWNFSSLSRTLKFLGFIAIFSTILTGVLTGTNRVLFNYIIISVIFICYKYRIINILKPARFLSATLIFLLALSAFSFFISGQISRPGSSAKTGIDSVIGSTSSFDATSGTLPILYSSLTNYLSQGYHAFDLALKEPFDFTYGVGNSTFLSRQVDRVFDTDLEDRSYPARIEHAGWNRYVYWSTFYVWWASDLGFSGVTVLMFLIGGFFRLLHNTLQKYDDPALVILYSYFIILLFYLSANNQIFQSGPLLIGFFAIFIPFVIQRKIYRTYRVK